MRVNKYPSLVRKVAKYLECRAAFAGFYEGKIVICLLPALEEGDDENIVMALGYPSYALVESPDSDKFELINDTTLKITAASNEYCREHKIKLKYLS